MNGLEDLVTERLEGLGYRCKEGDRRLIERAAEKVERRIKNLCGTEFFPEELLYEAIDMAAGEFLKAKKTFFPKDLEGFDLTAAVKRVQVGDTNATFASGEGALTEEQRLDGFISLLLNSGREQIACFRKVKW
ncbi:MAG: hypothetical protein NC203_02960 [Firmicutes bacterium]|nr:hypothetical protein [[Eubacterium] siraeum]MCM1487304.1 hypothetical protein [Bacillota bacterium]